jgi:S-methylmethionine-dependent homocysteine/selenocysteine methylase
VKCSGNYGEYVTLKTLKEFHRRRLQVLAEAGPDLIAFETIPNKTETQVSTLECFFILFFLLLLVLQQLK